MNAKRSNRMLRAALLGSAMAITISAGAHAQQDAREFDIPAQDAVSAFQAFARQSGKQVLLPYEDVAGRRVPTIKGRLPEDEVLKRLASAADLVVTSDDGETITLQPRDKAAPTVDPSSPAVRVDELVVTASRQPQIISRVPISVSALSGEQMERRGIRNVEEALRHTPGVDFSVRGMSNGSRTSVAIRGISSTAGASTTGVYIDDTPIQVRFGSASITNAYPRIFDLERLEVLRGPQGTLFGAGSQGGTLRFITPDPSLRAHSGYIRGEMAFTQDGDPSYEFGAAAGGPIIEGVLGFRISAWHRQEGGFVDRVDAQSMVVARRPDSQEFAVLRAALAYQPTDNLTITPSVFFQEAYSGDTRRFYEHLSDLDAGVLRNGRAIAQPTRDQFYLPALKVEYELPGAKLISNTSYFTRRNSAVFDYTNFDAFLFTGNPYPTIPGQNAPSYQHDKQDVFAQELRVQSADRDARLTWVAGLFYSDARQSTLQEAEDRFIPEIIQNTFGVPITQFLGSDLLNGRILFLGTVASKDKQYAGFGEATYALTPRLKIIAGARVAKVMLDSRTGADGPANGGPSLVSGKQSDTPVTPKVGLSYQLSDSNMIYATAAKGFRQGGVNAPVGSNCGPDLADLGVSSVPSAYKPDTVWSYEAGLKGRVMDNRVRFAASAFHIDWSGIQQTLSLARCGRVFVANVGEARSRGFEVELTGQLSDGLSAGVSGGYTDAEYTTTITGSLRANGTRPVLVERGDKLPGSAWQAAVWAQYDFEFYTLPAYVRSDFTYRGRVNGPTVVQNPATTSYDPHVPLDPPTRYWTARAGVTVVRWELSAFVDNLLNSQPLLQRGHDVKGSPLFTAHTLRPRTIGLAAALRY